jgi:outer membrane biosynthesis protein TonB
MSTAEITFSVGELANERRQEARKILWALLAAVLIHILVGFLLAIVSAVQTVPIPEEDKPVELTIVDMSPVEPAKPKNAPFIETDESRQSTAAPKDKTFQSNANSIGASESAPSGGLALPSQEGKERDSLELESQRHSLANRGAPAQPAVAQPSVAPQSTAPPEPTPAASQAPTVAPTAPPDQLAMLTARPTPAIQQSATPVPEVQVTPVPQQPSSAYRPERQKTRIGGNISNRGISSVNALGTPLGRYQKIVTDAIGSRWYAYTQSKADLITIGTLSAHFVVDRSGKIKDLRILKNTSNETFANICLQSIMEANLPPIPEDVAATLPSEGLEWDGVNFIMYPN